MDRERVLRTLTFWLRPEFVLRVVSRFQKVAGFDRAIALASSGLTAVIPLGLVTSAVFARLGGGEDLSDRIIRRYDLEGDGAEAVEVMFSASGDVSPSLGLIGFLFLVIAVLSFTRVVQRLFEQTWELPPLSVRNSANGLLWIGGLLLYTTISGALHALLGGTDLEIRAALLVMPLSGAFLIWSGSLLSGKRVSRHDLIPFGVVGAALLAIYSVASQVYVPELFTTYASRYGVIGAVFAMISTLFCVMLILVGSAALGREIREELDRIGRGEKPAEDEVQHQWDEITAEARSRWEGLQARREERRRRKTSR